MLTRRSFIRVLGAGGAAGALIAGGGYWASTRGAMPESAIAPWNNPGQDMDDPRLKAAAIAMLAPNPHNLQSWQIRLIGEDRLHLYVDSQRLLPHTDPYSRQIMIGQGTFLELFRMAAAEMGYRAEITRFPAGAPDADTFDTRPVAEVKLMADRAVTRDPLFESVAKRRSNKEPFDTDDPLTGGELQRLRSLPNLMTSLKGTVETEAVQALRELTHQALVLELETPRTFKESIDLMRMGPEAVAANPDGIDLLGPMIWWGERLGLLSLEDIATPGTQSFQVGLDMARDQAQSATGFIWLTTPDNSRVSQLQAGQDLLRLNLYATALGIAFHPMSQLLQEYPEMTALQQRFLKQTGENGQGQVQMLIRLGHAQSPGPSPRRRVGDIVSG